MTADGKRHAVVVCNEDKENAVTFKWKPGDELPIAHQCTYLGIDISKYCSWGAHTAKILVNDKLSTRRQDGCDPHLLSTSI